MPAEEDRDKLEAVRARGGTRRSSAAEALGAGGSVAVHPVS